MKLDITKSGFALDVTHGNIGDEVDNEANRDVCLPYDEEAFAQSVE